MKITGEPMQYSFNDQGDILITRKVVKDDGEITSATVTISVGKAMIPETLVDEARGRGWLTSEPPLRVDGDPPMVRMWRSAPSADAIPGASAAEQPPK